MRAGNDSSHSASEGFGESGSGVNINVNTEGAHAEALSVGQQLRAAREAHGLTVTDITRALKLSLNQVEAIEADDWDRLPGKTIIRGFVRNYARLLGLDSNRMMSDLEGRALPQSPELRMSAGTPVRFSQESNTDRHDFIRILSGVVILILAMLAYFLMPQDWWQSTLTSIRNLTQPHRVTASHDGADGTSAAGAVGSVALTGESPSTTVVALQPMVIVPDNKVVAIENPLAPPAAPEPAAATPEPALELAPEAQLALPTADLSLSFSFKQPAWVEVRDASGKAIFSQLNQAGTQRVVEGKPPFTLVVGNASNVALKYKGEAVDLAKRSKDDVARFTLE